MFKDNQNRIILQFMIIAILTVISTAKVRDSIAGPKKIKNVIIMIGDGMGVQEIALLNAYAKYAPDSVYKEKGRKTALEKAMQIGSIGYVYTESVNALVADSAASTSQIASGKWALPETIGIDRYGNVVETILEKAKKMQKATGLVTDTKITHATPAAFAAHQVHRLKENEIAVDMLNNNVDVMLGGGVEHWIPQQSNDKKSDVYKQLVERLNTNINVISKRDDNRNLLTEAELKGYTVVHTKDQLNLFKRSKILGLFSYSAMPNGIVQTLTKNSLTRSIPNLKEITSKALEILSKSEKGFFLMVEAGQIDWAAHNNDAGTLLHELLQLDETLEYILGWIRNRKDTLLIVTSDHETGGFGFSYSRINLPKIQDFPGKTFKGEKLAPNFNFGSYELLDKLYNQKQSYNELMKEFDRLPKNRQNPVTLMKIINKKTDFPITQVEAAKVLETENNAYFVKDHCYLEVDKFPRINDFKEFYVRSDHAREAILGRIVAKYQNVVWSTGTHTNSLVPIIAVGPKDIIGWYDHMMHTTEWGQHVIDLFITE